MKSVAFLVFAVLVMALLAFLPRGERDDAGTANIGSGNVGFAGGEVRWVTPTPGGIRLRP